MPETKRQKSEAKKILTLEEKARRLRMTKQGYISYRAADNIQRWLESTSVNIIIALLILVSVFLIILEFLLPKGPRLTNIEELNDILTWFFCVELTLRGLVARNKKIFFSNYWIDIIAVIPLFRFFRTLRVLRLLRILRLARAATLLLKESGWLSSRLEKHFGSFGFLALTAALLIVCSAVAYLNFERINPDTAIPISTLGDQVWNSSLLFISGEVVGEIPKTKGGKIVTLLTTLAGLVVFAIMVGTISAAMTNYFKSRMEAHDLQLKDLENHIIICGYDSKVDIILQELEAAPDVWRRGVVLVAETEKNLLELPLKNKKRLFHLNQDFTKIEVLEKAGAAKAKTALVLTDSGLTGKNLGDQDRDARTVLAALTIEKLNPTIFTCAELISADNASHLKLAGVEEIVSRNNLSAGLFASSAVNEGISGIVSDILSHKEGNYFRKMDLPMDLVGKTFYEATNYFKKELDSLLIAVERVEENGLTEQHVNPFRDYELLEGDRLTLIIKRNSSICDL